MVGIFLETQQEESRVRILPRRKRWETELESGEGVAETGPNGGLPRPIPSSDSGVRVVRGLAY